jgi:hypothetical protein
MADINRLHESFLSVGGTRKTSLIIRTNNLFEGLSKFGRIFDTLMQSILPILNQ